MQVQIFLAKQQKRHESLFQTASAGKKLDFRWDSDPCDGTSLTRCRPIYFRLIGLDGGGARCLTEDGFPCRTADSALVEVEHKGMLCKGGRNEVNLVLLFLVLWRSLI